MHVALVQYDIDWQTYSSSKHAAYLLTYYLLHIRQSYCSQFYRRGRRQSLSTLPCPVQSSLSSLLRFTCHNRVDLWTLTLTLIQTMSSHVRSHFFWRSKTFQTSVCLLTPACLVCQGKHFFADVEHDLSGGYCHECEEHHHILSVDETGLGCARFRRVWSS